MRVLQGFLLSVLIHLILLLIVQQMPVGTQWDPKDKVTIEIIDPSKSQNETSRQVVRQAQTPEQEKLRDESEDKLAFLSEQAQRVKKQTRALLNGMTRNRAEKEKAADKTKELLRRDFDAFSPAYKKTSPIKDIQADKGLSTIGETLPTDISVGSFTALNTDRYLFYSFYARIEELIRYRWESAVRMAIDSTPPDHFSPNASGVWKTNVEIWLKPNGEYHSAHIMKESGFRSFDRAAVQAFIQARLFPNPPKEMVEADGLIHLKYNFHVFHEPKVLGRRTE
jgi:TonB family protein